MSEKKLHAFSKDGRSCIINTPHTPRHWYNYMWNEQGYCVQVSQFGHGRSYYIDESANMCRINSDSARYIYLRDEDSKAYWNIGEGPCSEPVESFVCEHNISYTSISSEKHSIRASWRLFVPQEGYNEVWTVKVKNNSDENRRISVFSAVSFDMEGLKYPRYYEMYRCCETFFDEGLEGIFLKSAHPFAPHKRYNAYISSSEKVHAYDGDMIAFLGTLSMVNRTDNSQGGMYQRPEVVIKGRDCTNSTTTNFMLGGVLQNKITLAPGEEKEIHFLLGLCESIEEARNISRKYFTKGAVTKALKHTQEFHEQKYSSLSINTPDDRINRIMNSWLKKQVDFCIVGKKGVRDNLQIAVALLNYRVEKAKQEILEVLKHQFKDGHAVLTWYPYDDTRYSDQPFWIVWAVIELIKETGDYSILEEEIEYQEGAADTVLEHMKAAINRLLEDKGANGLTKIFFADWNDALNITTDPEAESVMLSEQLCLALKEMSTLCEKIGDEKYSDYLMEQYQSMRASINKNAWDGEWYIRATCKQGNIGSKYSTGSKIYINSQVWAILADIPDADRLPMVIKSIDSMEHDFGFPINMPPYMEYSPHVGRMSGMLPGLYENGGVYCHASAFKILMDCKVGRGAEAINTLYKIIPDSELNPSSQSGAEPYVFTNCYSIHPKYYGKSYHSWTTGTSAWALMGLYEGILGLKRDYDGLRIDPCMPEQWKRIEAVRVFRNTKYHITIENPEGISKGTVDITIDGTKLQGDLLPTYDDEKLHHVVINIRK